MKQLSIYTMSMVLILLQCHIVKAQSIVYFDKNWDETNKDNAAYYRHLPLKQVGELLYIQDFYMNGEMQMQGYVLVDNKQQYVGDVYWYDANGYDASLRQYENRTTTKELSYYNADGTLWQKIDYNDQGTKERVTHYLNNKEIAVGQIDNRIFSGTFNSKHHLDVYYDRYLSYDSPEAPITATAPPPLPKESQPNFTITTFWKNGQKAQELICQNDHYFASFRVLQQKFYNKEGTLLSDIKNNSPLEDSYYIFDFFTANFFAVGIDRQAQNKNGQKHGTSEYFTKDGQLDYTETYDQGQLVEKQYVKNNPNGLKSVYRDGVPYDGFFEVNIPFNVRTTFTMKNGRKVGQQLSKKAENNEIVTEGIYIDNHPQEGSFLITDEDEQGIKLLRYKDGLQQGLQQEFLGYSMEIPISTYEMKEGKLHGEVATHVYPDLTYKSNYRDGVPWSGEVVVGDLIIESYEHGQLIKSIRYDNTYDKEYFVTMYYEKGEIASVEYNTFTIEEDIQQKYTGIYKNGKPEKGYFILDSLLHEIPMIDYFENGQHKHRYSYDYIDKDQFLPPFYYDIKSTYINDTVYDGPAYEEYKNSVAIITYKEGKVIKVDIDIFAMHYFNRITFGLEEQDIIISEMQAPHRHIKTSLEGDRLHAELIDNGQVKVSSKKKQNESTNNTVNSMILFYLEDNVLKTSSISLNQDIDAFSDDNPSFLSNMMAPFPIVISDSENPLEACYKYFFTKGDFLMDGFDDLSFNDPEKLYLSFLFYNKDGIIEKGVDIQEEADGKFTLKAYKANKMVKTVQVGSVDKLEEVIWDLDEEFKFDIPY